MSWSMSQKLHHWCLLGNNKFFSFYGRKMTYRKITYRKITYRKITYRKITYSDRSL